MKYIKKNKNIIVAFGVFTLVLIGIFFVKNLFSPNESSVIYGNRLEGIKNVKITSKTINETKNKLNDETSNVEVRIAGRIVYIIMKAKEETSLDAAKELGVKSLEPFSEKEKKYYDFQIFIENDKNTSQFPIIGYKHHTKESITWTKDRAEN